jgi:hypothetical protein
VKMAGWRQILSSMSLYIVLHPGWAPSPWKCEVLRGLENQAGPFQHCLPAACSWHRTLNCT